MGVRVSIAPATSKTILQHNYAPLSVHPLCAELPNGMRHCEGLGLAKPSHELKEQSFPVRSQELQKHLEKLLAGSYQYFQALSSSLCTTTIPYPFQHIQMCGECLN